MKENLSENSDKLISESEIDDYPEVYEFDPEESSVVIYARFRSASIVEGDVGLHFEVYETRSSVVFYFFDIDPEEEGLFIYKEVEGSAFPELVTKPEIGNYLLTLYWELEWRQYCLSDESGDVPVLKKIGKEDISDDYD